MYVDRAEDRYSDCQTDAVTTVPPWRLIYIETPTTASRTVVSRSPISSRRTPKICLSPSAQVRKVSR
jgi:hypothetical protein